MKNWTRVCQELRYAATGEVYTNGEWMRTSDRGTAVSVMAVQNGTLIRVLSLAMNELTGMFEKYRDACTAATEEFRKWAASLCMIQTVTPPTPVSTNFAAMCDSERQWVDLKGFQRIVHGTTP